MCKRLHTYRIELADDIIGCARRIELKGPTVFGALSLAQRTLVGREIELYEDEQPLGRLRYSEDGICTVLPMTNVAAAHAPPQRDQAA